MQRLISFILIMFCNSVFADNIVLYTDLGAGERSLKDTKLMLYRNFPKDKIIEVSAQNVIDGFWRKNAKIFVMPGGADLGYVKKLNGAGNQQIIEYVEGGGKYLGICAGAYYASAYLRFKDKFVVEGSRELKFFPGSSVGPTYKGFSPHNREGARAVNITLDGTAYPVYYYGGGSFKNANTFREVKILAHYATKQPAIVITEVGAGKALLSGVHFEYEPELNEHEDYDLQHMDLKLLHQTNKRKELTVKVLHELMDS